ncbi:MAG: adenylate/guanylate cyclase domain-containing protein [Candidatus Scalindua sp. AMX11]|nr:MAG: adenylate/guanylate cyclase domain-containing protein [Candidatus Scalindua sp.]NOG85708.1 adenylate/guanylate cyclase domain-containing protein [Planctomycetota bacterium]RZV73158.1 MAG: adenylate/guanylate cyclase domain-containing protein [Candidatus Scalindua sp. SCAELEC01]TDE64753.1 MAG: adenylate/guanylate cyclase domain-containing protein [Candidatus Scalindua sp. AMX11]GJQ58682.1 MAG: adenylate/guanylate cyclase domain-containing protein [Candidatus Scalindua sp.]
MRSLRKQLRSPLSIGLWVSTLVFLAIMGLRITGCLESLELAVYDRYLRLRPQNQRSDSLIVLITVSEQDIRNQGQWPVTDATIALALEKLTDYQPRAIGLDLFRDTPIPPGSQDLDKVLYENKHIVTINKFGNKDETKIDPPSVLRNTDQVGFCDIIVDPGGIVRRGILFMDDGETVEYSFALRLALLYLKSEGIEPQPDPLNPEHMRLGNTTIRPFAENDGGYIQADANGYQFLLDYKDDRNSFPTISLTDLLTGKIEPEMITDKIAIIGVTAQGVKDFFYTPHSRGLNVNQHISGVALHAHMASQLLRTGLEDDASTGTMSNTLETLWILVWSFIGGTMGLGIRSPWRFSLFASSVLLLHAAIVYAVFINGWWLPLVPSATTWFLSAVVVSTSLSKQEKEQREILMQLFSKHVSQEVADIVWQQRDQFLDGNRPRSQKMTVTVLFTDIKGFTSVSEKMAPQELMTWLNTYMESMSQLVVKHGGVLDDYSGDGLKADFGIPFTRNSETEIGHDAVNAVDCALAMEEKMHQLNADWKKRGLPTVGMRIGLFTGPIVAGSLGCAQRLKYTTIGDTVNIASRLESLQNDVLSKDIGDTLCRILIGEATLRYLNHQFDVIKVGETALKGRSEKIAVYRIIGRNGSKQKKMVDRVRP